MIPSSGAQAKPSTAQRQAVSPHRAPSSPSSSGAAGSAPPSGGRSEEHTSELQSLMRISYAVLCLKKKNIPRAAKFLSSHVGAEPICVGPQYSHQTSVDHKSKAPHSRQ